MKNEGLPSNLIAEKSLLAQLSVNSDTIIQVADYLVPHDFYLTTHEQIFKAILTLYKRGEEVDLLTVTAELEKENIDSKPAKEDLMECYRGELSFLGNVSYLSKEIKNKSILRQLIGITGRSSMGSRMDDAEALSIISNLEKELVELSDVFKDDKPSDSQGILNEINADIARGEESGWRGFNTGFSKIDERTGGLIPTQCWVIGAYTGIGKTFFILQMILNLLENKAKVMLVSTEMDRKMNMLRLIANIGGLGTIKILKGQLDENEKARMLDAQKKLSDYKHALTIYDGVYTVEEIRLKAKKKKLNEGLDVLFVDFIQNLRGAENIYERMSTAAISLQQLAQELNITLVMASQVNQAAAGWQSGGAIEYKGAGEIAAVADVALWMKKIDESQDKEGTARRVAVRKVRHGVPGHFDFRITFPSGRIIELDESLATATPKTEEKGGVSEQISAI